MKKYVAIFAVSWENEFVYRLNFVLWRFRNVVRLLLTFFLWKGLLTSNSNVFGYSKSEMFAYVFLVLLVQSLVLSAPSADNVGGEISSGDLSNYLVKPIDYLKYWFTRDLSSKILNLVFAGVEIFFLWILLKPDIGIVFRISSGVGFAIALGLAVVIYFFLNVTTKFVAFWMPENTWGITFLTLVLIEMLAGVIFPIDVMPVWLKTTVQFTPFPYLVYYPIAILLGKLSGWGLIRILLQSCAWMILMFFAAKLIWKRGLFNYQSEGR